MKVLSMLFCCLLLLQAHTPKENAAMARMYGKVTDEDTGEELIGANVILEKNGVVAAGAATDFEGNYSINVDPGTYDVTIAYTGYPDQKVTGIVMTAGASTKVNFQMSQGVSLDEVVVTSYKVPLLSQDQTTSGSTISMPGRMDRSATRTRTTSRKRKSKKKRKKKNQKAATTVTSQQIQNLPTKNVSSIAAKAAGVTVEPDHVNVKGSRNNATDYYIDGIRVTGNKDLIPSSELSQNAMPSSGGVEAAYANQAEKAKATKDVRPSMLKQASPSTPVQATPPAPVQEPIHGEHYAPLVENEFRSPSDEAFSTFSIDVDNASYSNIRRMIQQGHVPPRFAVRTEEMVNYFNYDYPQPVAEHPFRVFTELTDCPWNKGHQLLKVALKGEDLNVEQAPPSNLVFLIDVSGSMQSPNKLNLIKPALHLLVDELRPNDRVAIVVYAGAAGLVLPSTLVREKQKIKDAISNLTAGGSTAGGAGIKLAYKIAQSNILTGGNNRVILATDGDFNVGTSSRRELEKLIETKRARNVFLTVLGFGYGNLQDHKLETLADKGNGHYAYIDNMKEATKVFQTELPSTLYTIAKDVKLQLIFNEAVVESYRLVGYENRLLNKEDFDDDTKDAGELGAGHSVTAFYEIIPKQSKPTSENLLTLKLRYKWPRSYESILMEHTVAAETVSFPKSSDNFRWACAVAGFSLLLRDSKFKGDLNYKMVLELANSAKGADRFGYRSAFIQMVKDSELLTISAKK